jgi:outer membrane protein insertion porin family
MMRAIILVVFVACGGGKATPKHRPDIDKPIDKPAALPESKELVGNITKITVQGATAESTRTQVETAMAGVKGKPLDQDKLRAALVDIMKMPAVADVTVHGTQAADGVELVVQVVSQPLMKKLTATEDGGKTIPLGMAAMPNNSPLEPARIQTLAQSLRDRYVGSGHFNAEVTWKKVAVEGGVDVVIEVKPGPPATIGSIAYKGNKAAKKTLDAQVAPVLVVGEPVSSEKIGLAAEKLHHWYWDNGFPNVKIKTPEPVAGKNALVFVIEEGALFKIGKIEIKSALTLENAKLLKTFGVKQGDVFSRTKIADGRQRVLDEVAKTTGKPNVDVLPLTKLDLEKKKIDFTLEITAGPSGGGN